MRRVALAALLALWPALASAQFATIGPTPAVSDNGDRIATTAWVNNFVANGIPLASGKIFIGSVGNIATAQTPSGDCTLSITGVITCTQAAGNFQVIGNLTVGGSIIDGNGILFTNIVAPATPGAGLTRGYVDSTTKRLSDKNDAGTVGNTVVASLAVANQFITGISSAGVITRAQPNFTDLAGSGSCAQEPAMTGDVTSSAGSCALAIGANKVTRAMEAQGVARSVIGVTGNATANVADIQGTANQFLGVNSAGTALAFNTMSQDCTLATGVITCTKTNNVSFTAGATAAAGQLPGEPSTGNASAGNVGEYIEAVRVVGSALALSTATPANLTASPLSLTAGDWDVDVVCTFGGGATTTVTYVGCGLSLTTATIDQTNGRWIAVPFFNQAVYNGTATATTGIAIPPLRFSFSGTTSVFAVVQSAFAVSTSNTYGILRARRVR